MAQFDDILENDDIMELCSNPLYLTLLCCLQAEGNCSITSRTGLHKSIHRLILRKASKRLKINLEEAEQLMQPLYQLAFEVYQKNDYAVQESDLEKLSGREEIAQVGYLTKKIKKVRLESKVNYHFTHKTFIETPLS